MKTLSIFLSLFFVFGAATVVCAQTFSIGPRAGVNFAKIEGNNFESQANTSLVLGITSTYSISEKSGIGVDVLYSGEGAEGSNFGDLSLDYIRVPVMFQYFFRDLEDDFRPKIYAGVAPGFLIDAKQGDREVMDDYNNFDLAGTAGLGFHYRLSPRGIWLNADGRYLHGFSSIVDATPELNNRHWQVSLGLSFGLDR